MNKRLFIATPAYSGKVNVQYALSLGDTNVLLQSKGYRPEIYISTSGSLLVAERNRILEKFWQSGCDKLLCIDADLGWPAEAVLAFLESDKEFIAGVYPARKCTGFTFRPKLRENQSIITDGALLGMEYIPAGFMMISRSALQKMRDKFPELYYSPKDSRAETESTYCLFNTEVWDGEFWGEDYVFCRKAREAGVEIWVDPRVTFDHDGLVGCLLSVITDKSPEEQMLNAEPISEAA